MVIFRLKADVAINQADGNRFWSSPSHSGCPERRGEEASAVQGQARNEKERSAAHWGGSTQCTVDANERGGDRGRDATA